MGKRDAIRLLLDTARALSREPDLDALFARLHELVARDFPCWSFIIALAEPDETMLRVAFYAEDGVRQPAIDRVPVEGTIGGSVFRTGEPRLIATHEAFTAQGAIPIGLRGTLNASSAIFAPLRTPEKTIGTISVQTREPGAYGDEDLQLFVAIAEQAATAVESSARLRQIAEQRSELEMLVEMARGLLADEFSITQMCRRVAHHLRALMDAHVFYLGLIDDEHRLVLPEYCIEGDTELDLRAVPLERSVAYEAIRQGAAVVYGSRDEYDRSHYRHFGETSAPSESIVILPLLCENAPIGFVSVQSPRQDAFDAKCVRIMRAMADHLALLVKNVTIYRLTEQRADRDPLTNLYNRRYAMRRLGEELERAARNGSRVCAMMIDLDRFKQINDRHGHLTGDHALRMMSEALRAACRGSDVICRFGGDEFLLILPEFHEESTGAMIKRIRYEIARRNVPVPGGAISIDASVGAAISTGGTDAAAVLAEADRRLYDDKASARNTGA